MLAAKRRAETEVMLPPGPKTAFADGYECNDHNAIWSAPDRAHARRSVNGEPRQVLSEAGFAESRRHRECLELGMVSRFGFSGGHVSDRLEQTAVVEPLDPFQDSELQLRVSAKVLVGGSLRFCRGDSVRARGGISLMAAV